MDLQKVEPISLENHEEKVCKSFYLGYTIQYSHCKHRTTGNEEKYKATFFNIVWCKGWGFIAVFFLHFGDVAAVAIIYKIVSQKLAYKLDMKV